MIDSELLEHLGVEVTRVGDREIQALCPVHHLVKGRPDTRPSWYMNRATGAWLCFSCQQRGSLSFLAELMGVDDDMLTEAQDDILVTTTQRWDEDEEEAKPLIHISEYGFSKNPFPPKAIRQLRDIRKDACEALNVRWSTEGRCFLIPLYTTDGKLIGWQEKAKGYFMNVPDEVPKRLCLFGYQQYMRGPMIVVESPLDVVRLQSHGVRGGVATFGAYVSTEQIEAMVAAADDIILAFDNDDAGIEARERVSRTIQRQNLAKVRFFAYPGSAKKYGKDVGELEWQYVVEGIDTASSFVRA